MINIKVCIGSACHINGAYNVIQAFQQIIEENSLHDKVELSAAFCMKECQNRGVSVSVDGEKHSITPEGAREFFKSMVMAQI